MQGNLKTIGMVFDNIEATWNFWTCYGGKVGFKGRKHSTHKKKDGSISSCRFIYCKDGFRKPNKRDYKAINPRPETKTNCKAKL